MCLIYNVKVKYTRYIFDHEMISIHIKGSVRALHEGVMCASSQFPNIDAHACLY